MSDRRLWLEEPCVACGAPSGLRCQTSRYVSHPGRPASGPAAQRACSPGAAELFAEQGVGEALERCEAATALVRFAGGGGNQGSIAAVTLEMWDVQERQVVVAGERGGQKFEELLSASWKRYRSPLTPVAVAAGDGVARIRCLGAPRYRAGRRCPGGLALVRELRRAPSPRGGERTRATAPSAAVRPPRTRD